MATHDTPLRKWRKAQARPVAYLAAEVGVTVQAWYDWERSRRLPSRAFMPRLVLLTGDAVTANDFYALPGDLAA